jgi:thymidylate synthase
MSQADQIFKGFLSTILETNDKIVTRNSEVYRDIGLTAFFDKTPLITIRRTAWKNALREWEWFMSGSNDIKDLHPSVHSWWKPWANENGIIPNNYSIQFRKYAGFNGIYDQIQGVIEGVKNHPYSRRNIISTWHSFDMNDPKTPITNCHTSLLQFFVKKDKLYFLTNQRSADVVLGLPHNLIQSWAFLLFMAKATEYEVGGFTWIGGDCHIYMDHVEMAKKIIDYKEEIPQNTLVYKGDGQVFRASDFELQEKYEPIFQESLKMTV